MVHVTRRLRVAVGILCLLISATAFADWPPPGGKCVGCAGRNSWRQANAGLPTVATPPALRFAGRIVDSYDTINVQNVGIRTVRAREVRVAPDGQRIYIALGEAVGAYDTSTFFARLGQPLKSVSGMRTGGKVGRYGKPIEKAMLPDALFYAESRFSGWRTTFGDFQQVLGGFDASGAHFFAAARFFGWGIHQVAGASGAHMPFIHQARAVNADRIVALGAQVLVSDYKAKKTLVYDVSNPRAPKLLRTEPVVIADWARSGDRLAMVATDGTARIYGTGAPDSPCPCTESTAAAVQLTPRRGFRFTDVAIDGENIVLTEGRPSGTTPGALTILGATKRTMTLDINPTHLAVGAGYVAIGGIGRATGARAREVRIFKGPSLQPVATGNFFTAFYHRSPRGYARPEKNVDLVDLQLVSYSGKVFLFYMANGLADVYEVRP